MKKAAFVFAVLALLSNPSRAAENGYSVIDRIAGPDGKWDYISIDETNSRALIAHGDRVTAVDLPTRAVTESFAKGEQIHTALPINGDAEILITNGESGSATIADGKTGEIRASIPAGQKPDAATFDPATGLVLVMDHAGGDITLIDPKERNITGSIAVDGTLEGAAVDGEGLAYVNVEDRSEVAVIDIPGQKVLRRYSLDQCDSPTGIVYARQTKQLVIACDGAAQVRDATDGKLVANFAIGGGADGAAYDAVGQLAFVPSGATGTLSVISLKGTPQLIQTVKTRKGARTIAFDDKTGWIYLPTAKFGAAKPGEKHPPILPGSFEILVIGK